MDTETRDEEKNDVISEKLHFRFMGELRIGDYIGLLKTWQGKNDGYSWKINAIRWNIKINLQKMADRPICGMWTMNCQQICKISRKKT